jgi:hypothetical protein
MRFALSIIILASLASASQADALKWQKSSSPTQMAAAEAERFCTDQGPGWRLPNRAELASLLADPEAPESKFAANAPALPKDGYLWSGEDVSSSRKGQKWIMNLANGHIFNGDGRTGYAKCVNGAPIEEPEAPLGAPMTSIGRADAKVVSIVAMQPDYFWFKVRPVLDKLAATRSVRFELHLYLTDRERYLADSIALCAAAKIGKFTELEQQLATKKPDRAWLKFDDATVKACQAAIDQDQRALRKKDIGGVPTFLIGKTIILGAQPIEKFETAIKAAGG